MKSLSILIVLANTLFASSPTDLALLKKVVDGALVNYTLNAAVSQLAVQNEGLAEENLFIRDALFDKFQTQGIEVFYNAPPDTAAFDLAYRVTELGVYYQHQFKKLPWGPNYIKRLARAEFQLILSKNRQVLESESLQNEYSDVVLEKDLPLLRSKQFTHEETLTTSPSLWEPLFVAAIVGLLVIAFYGPKTF